jgi:biopolymer transport protein ExbD
MPKAKMLIKRKARGGIENSSALSDLAFLLIIYFIIIAGFNVNKGFLLNLPRKDSILTVPRDELLRFSIDGRGSLFFMENQMSFEEARVKITSTMAERPNTALILSIDEQAPWQNVVSFVELAQENQVDSFSFSLRKQTEYAGEQP